MAQKPAKQAQKPAKLDSTLDPTQRANSYANKEATDASMMTNPDQILTAIQALKEDFISRFDGQCNTRGTS